MLVEARDEIAHIVIRPEAKPLKVRRDAKALKRDC
jgi:hypothetical protein